MHQLLQSLTAAVLVQALLQQVTIPAHDSVALSSMRTGVTSMACAPATGLASHAISHSWAVRYAQACLPATAMARCKWYACCLTSCARPRRPSQAVNHHGVRIAGCAGHQLPARHMLA